MYKLGKIELDKDVQIGEQVYKILSKAIYANKLKPGEKLTEISLAETIGVSRTPIREALARLELEGLVVNRGIRALEVSEISYNDALSMYQTREVLEGLVVRLVCDNIPRKKINELKEIILEMSTITDKSHIQKLYELNDRWNYILLKYVKNEYLERLMIELYNQLGRLRPISMDNTELYKNIIEEYKNIVSYIDVGDKDGAEQAGREHVRKAKARFIDTYLKKHKEI